MANGLLGDPTALRGLLQSPSTTDFALAMLANSGYSNRRRSLGEIVGASMLQSRQMAAEQAQQKLREQYMQAQIQAMQAKQEPRPEELEIIAGEDGKPIYVPRSQAAGKSPFMQPRGEVSETAALQEYRTAVEQGYPKSFIEFKRDLANMGRAPAQGPNYAPQFDLQEIERADGTMGLFRFNQRTGQLEDTGQNAPKKLAPVPVPTATERTASNYAERMIAAEERIGNFVPSVLDYGAGMNMLAGGSLRGALANRALTPEGRQYFQAASDWVRAKLRKESGAVIGEDEMSAEIKTYFPLPGDDKVTVENKRISRQQAMAGMQGEAGRATQPPPPGRGAPENTSSSGAPRSFASVAEANAAEQRGELKKGDRIIINGRPARIE